MILDSTNLSQIIELLGLGIAIGLGAGGGAFVISLFVNMFYDVAQG